MSKRKTPTRCLVIDASVARAAGSLETKHPVGQRCRDFLMRIRAVCHRMAWSESIKAEWLKYQSAFALQWLVSMENLGKRRHLGETELPELREAIREGVSEEAIVAILLKDCHLVEAALATDGRVASLDETVRGHLGRLVATVDGLQSLLWVNPAADEEKAVEWLERGAPAEKRRQLGN